MAGKSKKPKWAEMREWLNVITAVAALLVGVVGLWATFQISGLEDYFRSEIAQRNNELTGLSARAVRLEAEADRRRSQLDELQLETNRLLVGGQEAQRQLSQTGAELDSVRFQTATARSELSSALSKLDAVNAEAAERGRVIDALRRREFYGVVLSYVAIVVSRKGSDFEGEGDFSYGSAALKVVQEIGPSGKVERDALLEEMKRDLPLVCPQLENATVKLERKPNSPSGLGQEAWDAYIKADIAWLDRRQAAMRKVADEVRECGCAALSTPQVQRQEICPA